MYADLTVPELKALAEERGIKKPGGGWSTCCPPNGKKEDIIKALNEQWLYAIFRDISGLS